MSRCACMVCRWCVDVLCRLPASPQRGPVYIPQTGVQWKQGVVVHIVLCAVLLYNTTPIHRTPLRLHPFDEYPACAVGHRGQKAASPAEFRRISGMIPTCVQDSNRIPAAQAALSLSLYIYIYIHTYMYVCIYIYREREREMSARRIPTGLRQLSVGQEQRWS